MKTVLPFLTNQAAWFCSRGIADFIFSREFHVASAWMDLSKIFDKTIGGEMKGEGVNIIQFSSILVGFSSMYFFYFKA